jgi:N-formylglutamate amidohydrolase
MPRAFFVYHCQDMKSVFSFQRGDTPLLVSVPHSGILVPPSIGERWTPLARELPDTDWFVDRLYHWVADKGASLLVANYSRYVIDLNRPPDNAALYSGSGTGLLPEQTFSGKALYKPGMGPVDSETDDRLGQFWMPYHQQMHMELHRLKQRYGYAILLDAHSILSEVPLLFEGALADLNLGSFAGASANPDLITAGMTALGKGLGFTLVLDGRFRGGYITRHYGDPLNGIHALQLEISQSAYMAEQQLDLDKRFYDENLARDLLPVLHGLVDTLTGWSPPDD